METNERNDIEASHTVAVAVVAARKKKKEEGIKKTKVLESEL